LTQPPDTVLRGPVTVPADWPTFLRDLDRIQRRFAVEDYRSRDGLPSCGVPYMPYSLEEFTALLTAALKYATGRRFLSAGCGPGVDMRLAEALFGGWLHVEGIDYLQRLVDEANRGRAVPAAFRADVRTWDYGEDDIVFYNRPVDGDEQDAAERHVCGSMRPGAVLIHVNGGLDPGRALGWTIVSAEEGGRGPVCGVWQKPAF
jgi:SAM-dependent methyltransferase